MVNYKNAKIYKLVNDELNLTYYGSTCNILRIRLSGHKQLTNTCCSKIMFESGEVKIYLVEKFPCNDKIELNQRERFYIENNNCINKKIPNRTYNEWYKTNKTKFNEYHKIYQKENMREYQKEYQKNYQKEYYLKNKQKKKEYYEQNKKTI